MAGTLLSEVVAQLDRREDASPEEIARVKLDRWMKSDEPEVLGAVYALVSDPRLAALIVPPLRQEELSTFLQTYFARCLRDDPRGDWIDSRYSAGWDIVQWLVALWDESLASRELLKNWKNWLGELYLTSDSAIRECIETATLEHLFEHQEIRELFADWSTHPVLGPAYQRCLEGPEGFLANQEQDLE